MSAGSSLAPPAISTESSSFPLFGILAVLVLVGGGYCGFTKMRAGADNVEEAIGAADTDGLGGEELVAAAPERATRRLSQTEEAAPKEQLVRRRGPETGEERSPEPSRASLSSADVVRHLAEIDVHLYATSWCGYCAKARAFFDANGVRYQDHDVESDPAAKAEKDRLSPNSGVPVVLIDGKVVSGFNPQGYGRALSQGIERASGVPVKLDLRAVE
jgi:glutaredoxin